MITKNLNRYGELLANIPEFISDEASIAPIEAIDRGLQKAGNKIKILQVEDVTSDANLIVRVVKQGNIDFERLVVDTRDNFVKALKEFCPDIILSDHTLPALIHTRRWQYLKKTV